MDHAEPRSVSGGHVPRARVATHEVAATMASWDWASTPVGDPATWPPTLRTMSRVLLGSRFSMWMGWGPDLTFFYNDAYRVDTLGVKHPWALGRPAREVWSEIWDEIGPRIETVLATGEATWDEGLQLFLERSGYPEETYHTFSYSAIRDADDRVAGLLCVVSEDTDRVIGERRMTALRELGAALTNLQSEAELFDAVERSLRACRPDLPLALVYRVDDDEAHLVATSGIDEGHGAAPATVELGSVGVWPLDPSPGGGPTVLHDLLDRFGTSLPTSVWNDPPQSAVVVPLELPGGLGTAGFLVAGLNPYRPIDEAYLGFARLYAGQVAAGIASVGALEAERRRSAALAEVDRAKTEFFSNVSHELRTPLTLIAGPVADSLADVADPLPAAQLERMRLIERSTARLRHLVNDLLDFAQIEAGGRRPRRRAVDASTLTRDLATSFAPAIERAGVELVVDCPPAPVPINLDVEMWEKIVLNLLSNALKFTLEGSISVAVRPDDRGVVLTVADTGVGIPAEELPRLFERFHRVASSRGRSHEGTGIGLALVAELAELHGGSASVESVEGRGSTFTVRLPNGEPDPDEASDADDRAGDFLSYAAGTWPVDRSPGSAADVERGPSAGPTVLVVDDNADLRGYLTQTLSPHWNVRVAADGREALDAVRASPPDLVLADVMMPELDGFGLLAQLRGDDATASIPVILLSARAGEEASIEGLLAGADDYLVKPFSSLDLIARVRSNLERSRFRREEALRRRRLVESLDEAVIVADEHGTVIEANPAFGALLGHDHLATPYPMPHPWWPTAEEDPEARARIDLAAGRALAGEHGRERLPLWHADGRRMFVDAAFSPLADDDRHRIVVSLRDVTAEVVAADRQSAVERLGVALTRATDRRAVGEAALVELRSLFGARFAAVLIGELDDPVVVAAPSDGLVGSPIDRDWTTTVSDALARNRSIEQRGASATPYRSLVDTVEDGEQSVTIWVELDPPRPVGDDELALFQLVCAHLGQALHRARLFDEQVEVATGMQRAILGPMLTPPGVAVRYVPAVRPLEVGGDWYDVIELDEDLFGVIVGDCVGKGLEAAAIMGQLRSAARALFLRDPEPAAVLRSLDAFARRLPGAECATAVCALVDRRTGAIRYTSAGHVPGVIVHRDGGREVLDRARATPLASLPSEFVEAQARVPPGSVLVLFTDGLVERRGEDLTVGIERLLTASASASERPPEAIADRILDELVPDDSQRDDIAVVVYAPRPVGEFAMSIDARSDELRSLRLALRCWLDDHGVADDIAADVLLATAEATANAVEHAYPGGSGTVQVRAALDDGRLDIEVRDAGSWRPPQHHDVTRGRGLLIMRSVMDDVDVVESAGGTAVRMARRALPSAAPRPDVTEEEPVRPH